MAIIASTANSSLHQLQTLDSQNNKNHLRVASFSSYLNSNEDTLVEKLAESNQNFNPFISNGKNPLRQRGKKQEDGEIGVFEAEKYFNGGEVESSRVTNLAARKCQHQKEEQTALETQKHKVQSGTPSIRSESSWNSQSALLQNSMGNSSRNKKKKVEGKSFLAGLEGKSFLAGLACKCYCSDENSVDVSDHTGEISFNKTATHGVVHGSLDANNSVKINKPQAELLTNKDVYLQKPEKLGVGLNRENTLAFPPVNSSLANQLVKMQLQQEEEEKPRKSLEVFGSPILDKRSKSLSFDKRLKMPSWDAHVAPKMEEIDISTNSGGNYNDAESDASSDLFEIESLTGKSNPFLGRQTSDVASGCVSPTTGYAPSEASIEWSVVTASAAEYSVLSDFEEQRSMATIRSPIKTSFTPSNGRTKSSREIQRRRPSNLLGCKSHKAVRVAGDAFITYEKPSSNPQPQIRRSSDNYPQVTRFQADTKQGNFGARHGQHAYGTPPLPRSHSPHASQLLYI